VNAFSFSEYFVEKLRSSESLSMYSIYVVQEGESLIYAKMYPCCGNRNVKVVWRCVCAAASASPNAEN